MTPAMPSCSLSVVCSLLACEQSCVVWPNIICLRKAQHTDGELCIWDGQDGLLQRNFSPDSSSNPAYFVEYNGNVWWTCGAVSTSAYIDIDANGLFTW